MIRATVFRVWKGNSSQSLKHHFGEEKPCVKSFSESFNWQSSRLWNISRSVGIKIFSGAKREREGIKAQPNFTRCTLSRFRRPKIVSEGKRKSLLKLEKKGSERGNLWYFREMVSLAQQDLFLNPSVTFWWFPSWLFPYSIKKSLETVTMTRS